MTDTTGTTSYGYDNASRLTSRTTPQGTVSFAYDDANRQTSRTITAGTTTLTYDNADRLTSAAAPGASGTETTSYSYDNANRQVTMTLPNGQVETKSYSSTTGDLSSIVRTASSSTVASYSYGYDNLGRKTSETLGGGDSTGYTYDAAGQLTAEARTGTVSYSIGYSYDYAGNRLTKTTGSGTEYYTYDDANKLLTAGTKSYSYDYAGNTTGVYNSATSTTTTLTWDGEERLKTAGNGSFSDAYAYNGLDQRSGKADSTGTFSLLRAGDGIASPVLADGAATYNYGAGLTSEVRSGTSKFYQADALGSTRELTNSSGTVTDAHETDAFGNTVASSGSTPTPFGFAGQAGYQTDSDTGLKLLGHRYYDSSTGRFISRDPIQDGDNWYVYCDNDPVNGVDPEGLERPKYDQSQLSPDDQKILNQALTSIGKTGTGSKLFNDLGGDGKTHTIHILPDGDKPHQFGNDVYIPLNTKLEYLTEAGWRPVTLLQVLAHELGHLDRTGDDGPNNMNNVNKWENPIITEVPQPDRQLPRLKYDGGLRKRGGTGQEVVF